MRRLLTNLASTALAIICVSGARAQIVMETVSIGNPGNPGKLSGETVQLYGLSTKMGNGAPRICGGVDYTFQMGKYEVTANQYVAFLNAIASTDPYSLYNTFAHPSGSTATINITRAGTSGNYTYSVPADWGVLPVGGIAWQDAARFANWMHNGQPTGVLTGTPALDAGLTEDGSYALNGALTNTAVAAVVRKTNATWVIPTEDEWFKAAYHKNNGPTGSYWEFPTQSDGSIFGAILSNDVINPDPGNSANYFNGFPNGGIGDNSSGPPKWRTPAGEFENSASAYGTFDQGGNVWEWTETVYINTAGAITTKRVLRGGSYTTVVENVDNLHSAWRDFLTPLNQTSPLGFRLARVGLVDCNANSISDDTDISSGTSHDYNFNGIPDECDITAGRSLDCNHNGIPDEAETGATAIPPYRWDDGTAEGEIGAEVPSDFVWLNQFTIEPGRTTISAIALSYGYKLGPAPLDGTPVTVYLWSDPNNDGVPFDAVVLASAPTTVMNSGITGFGNTINVVNIPETFVGPPGTKFFVGARLHIIDNPDGGTYPANIDGSSGGTGVIDKSWLFLDDVNPIDPNNLAAAPFSGSGSTFNLGGNVVVRAIAKSPVAIIDANHNGVPDPCEHCPADFNNDGVRTVGDIFSYLSAWFANSPSANFDNNSVVNVADIFAFLSRWFAGC